jgi:hypothetical protein
MNDARNEFAAPLGSATTGRLEFVRSAYNATIHADALATDLNRARFEGTAPDVRAEHGTVRVECPRTGNHLDWRGHSADIVLNAAVPWGVEVRGGTSQIKADLSGLRLESFEIDGGAGNVELTLAEPSGTASNSVAGPPVTSMPTTRSSETPNAAISLQAASKASSVASILRERITSPSSSSTHAQWAPLPTSKPT